MLLPKVTFALGVAFLMVSVSTTAAEFKPKFGTPISETDLESWNIDVRTTDGVGLPKGSGSVQQGAKVYQEKCLSCHGEGAKGGPVYGAMFGGIGSLASDKPARTIGSFWPHAPILYDYIYRAMPMDKPQSLTADEVYAVSAYLLHVNGLIAENAVMDAKTLPQVKMPNRDGFVPDDRPDTAATRCMTNCK